MAADNELQLVVRAIDEASATLAKVRSEVAAMASGAQADMDKIGAAAKTNQTHVMSFTGELVRLAAVVGIAQLSRQFADFGIGSAAALQTTSTNMQLLVGNTGQANKVMGDLYNFSRGTPFAFPDVANAAKTLLQFGATAQNVVPMVQMLGNVVAVTGANYGTLAEVYGEVNAAGKVQMNNVQQLIQDGVPIMQAMATVTGKSMTDIQDAMLKGSLSASVFDAAMQHIAPPDALNQMANTLPTRLSALQGALRSVAFELLGINIDPIKGFVIQAGGLFDQLSNGVAQLAKRLRDPDVQQAMVELGQVVTAIAGTVLPMLFEGLVLLTSHLKEIVPVLIAVGVAFGVVQFGQFIAGLYATAAGFVGLMLAAGPVTIALYALAAVIGVIVGQAFFDMMNHMGQVQTGMGNTTKAVQDGSAAIGQSANAGMGQASKAAQDLAEKLKDISDKVLQANQDFNESLANIVKTHQDKVSSLTDQINSEKDDFAKAQGQKTDDFKQSQADQLAAHNQKIQDLQRQLDDEVLRGRFADQRQVQNLKDRIAVENTQYDQSTAKKQATYDKDVANAKEASDDKLSKLQQQLNAENTFMQKHAADIAGIRASDALDEIQKLQQSHQRQLDSLNKQKDDMLKNAQDSTIGLAKTYNDFPKMIDSAAFKGVGSSLGSDMANAFRDSFYRAWSNFVNGIGNTVGNFVLNFASTTPAGVAMNAIPGGGLIASLMKAGHVPGFATGGVVPGPIGDPVLALVHGGEAITPPGGRFAGGQASPSNYGATINNVWHIYNQTDVSHAVDMQAWNLRNA